MKEGEDETRNRKKRWRKLEKQDLLPDECEVSCAGEVETDLLIAVRVIRLIVLRTGS